MAFNIGVNIVEVDGQAAPSISAAPISVAGFLVRSVRGVPNLAVPLGGFSDFVDNFGGYTLGLYGAHALRGFFGNGGTAAFAVRIVSDDAAAASATLRNAAATAVLRVTAARRGRPDPGAWGNALSVRVEEHARTTVPVPAQVESANAEPFVLADGQTLQITPNAASAPVTITFHASDFVAIGSASAAEVAGVINRATTSVRAGVTPDRRVLLASAASGGPSRVAVSAGAAATALGFTGANANSDGDLVNNTTLFALPSTGDLRPGSAVRIETRAGLVAVDPIAATIVDGASIDVSVDGGAPQVIAFHASDFVGGLAVVTPGEIKAAINRQASGFVADLAFDGRLVLMSNRFGPGSSLTISPGATDATAALGLSTAPTSIAAARQVRALDTVSETYRWASVAGSVLPQTPANFSRVQSIEFDLVVRLDGVEVERFESLSMQSGLDSYAIAMINDEQTGSRYVMLTDLGVAGPGDNVPAAGTTALGTTTAGSDGSVPGDNQYIGDPSKRTGLYALDGARLQLLATPETTAQGVVAAALSWCEQRGDAMFVGTVPRALDVEGTKTYAASLRGKKVYGALYGPWISIANPLDTTGATPRIWVPPVGHVLGTYARVGEARGVWKAPAGDEAFLAGALAVEYDMTDTDETDLVKNGGVNAIRALPGAGIVVDTSRTLSTDSRWLFVNVRRLFNFVKASLRDGLRWVSQEPHSEELRRAVRLNVVQPFLLGLWRRGAFGSDAPDKVFTIKCDASNNPPAEVQQGNFKIEVYFYPVKPAETIVVVVGQQESGGAASET